MSVKSLQGLMLGATQDLTARKCNLPHPPNFPGQVDLTESEIKPTQQVQNCLRPLERGGGREEEQKQRRKALGEGDSESVISRSPSQTRHPFVGSLSEFQKASVSIYRNGVLETLERQLL